MAQLYNCKAGQGTGGNPEKRIGRVVSVSKLYVMRTFNPRTTPRDIASYHDAFQQVATRAVYVLDMCLDEPPLSFPDAVPTAAAALAFLTAYSETMPRDTLLKDTHLLQHIVAAAIGSSIPDDDIRCLGWAAALALTRRLVERTSCFRSRLASAGLLPLLERARELLELAQQQPQRVFASLVCRRELMYALQLLCHVAGTGDAYYIARLHQLHMAEALLLFGQADVGAGVVDEEVTTLVVKLQGAACRLHGYLVMPPGD